MDAWDWAEWDIPGDAAPSLRPYQCSALAAADAELRAAGRCLVVLPTGTGKTELMAAMAADGDTLVVIPLTDLLSQTVTKLRSRGIECDVEQGVLRGGTSPVTVASYQSLIRGERWKQYVGKVKKVLVDESHTNYTKKSFQVLGELAEGGAGIAGFTASPQRMKGDPLTKFYGRCAYEYSLKQAIEDGWLCRAELFMSVAGPMDLSRFVKGIADFNAHELDRILKQEEMVHFIANLIVQHYDGLPSVAFCHSIQQAEAVVEVLDRHGVEASVVHSRQGEERGEQLEAFTSGRKKVICNVGCLTMGWDHAPVRNLFICKPTKSSAKYIQMFGRGTRTLPGTVDGLDTVEERRAAIAASGKPFFSVFDITDTSRHCELVSAVDVLCPGAQENLLKRAKRSLEGRAEGVDADELLAEEAAAEAREQAARDALERERRRNLVVGVTFSSFSRDPFAEAERPHKKIRQWHMLFGKHKGKPLRDVPTGYLTWVLAESRCTNRLFLQAVSGELQRRTRQAI